MVGSLVEPEWDDEQRAWMLALTEIEADSCPGCHGVLSETTATDEWGESLYRWEVPAPTRCHRCTALAARQGDKKYKEAKAPQALLWSTIKHLRGRRD